MANELLAHCRLGQIIIMDNASTHCNERVEELIRAYSLEIRYLPPYLPDLNFIELTFSIVKAWIRANFHRLWPYFQSSFGKFLKYTIENSRCDAYPCQHFCHDGYLFEDNIRELERKLEAERIDFHI